MRSTSPIVAGLSAAAVQSFVLKAAGIVCQIVCALFLTKEQFGEVAVGLGILALFNFSGAINLNAACLRRGKAACRWEVSACYFAVVFGAISMGIALLSSPLLVAWFNGNENTAFLIKIGCLSFIPNSLIGVRCAVLKGDFEFGEAARIVSLKSMADSIGTIFFAIGGWGAMSFVLPRVVTAWVVALVVFRKRLPALLSPLPSTFLRIVEIIRVGALSIPGFVALYITTQLDKLVVAKYFSLSEAGLYFFAYNLAAQSINVAGQIVRESIIPVLARENNPAVQVDRFARIIRTTLVFTSPLLMIQAVAIYPLLHFMYGNKWDAAAPLIQILSIAMAVRMGGIASGSLLKIQNRFGLLSFLNAIYGILFIGVVAMASQLKEIEFVTWAVLLFYTAISAVHFFVPIYKVAKRPIYMTINTFAVVPLALLAFSIPFYLSSIAFGWHTTAAALSTSLFGSVLYLAILFYFDGEMVTLIRNFLRRVGGSLIQPMKNK